jgi:DNA-binding transcriptional LysR family regulator
VHNLPALPDLKLFCVVLRHGSSRPRRELGASPSFVSKRVAALEAAPPFAARPPVG